MENRDWEHLLALKVMRLTRPSLCVTVPLTSEMNDLNHEQFEKFPTTDVAALYNIKNFSYGNLLTLPQSFGNIYLGETFSCYMSVHNDSPNVVKNVSVQADLQIGPQKLILMGQRDYSLISELQPNDSIDDVIHHEVKEIGTHILACTVSYTAEREEKMHFRKFFKFQVSKPLDVKTKFYNAESSEVFLEAQIQNITSAPMCLEKVMLESSSNFISRQLNTISCDDGMQQIFGSVTCLNPLDSRQYLFRLTPKEELQKTVKSLKGVASIGKLDIVWHTNMGEKGRLQTSQLERMAPCHGEIRLNVIESPSVVNLKKSFYVYALLSNMCERPLNLVLFLNNGASNGILWQGISGQQLKELQPHASVTLKFRGMAIKKGLLMISGIRLTDCFLQRSYEYDDLAQVYVSDEQI